MRCNKVQQRLSVYLRRETSEKERHRIHEHLEKCQLCLHEFDLITRLDDLLDIHPFIEASPGFLTRLHRRLDLDIEKETLIDSKIPWTRIFTLVNPTLQFTVMLIGFLLGGILGLGIFRQQNSIGSSQEISGSNNLLASVYSESFDLVGKQSIASVYMDISDIRQSDPNGDKTRSQL